MATGTPVKAMTQNAQRQLSGPAIAPAMPPAINGPASPADHFEPAVRGEDTGPRLDRVAVGKQRRVDRQRVALADADPEAGEEQPEGALHEPGREHDHRPHRHGDACDQRARMAVRERADGDGTDEEQHAECTADRAEHRVAHAERLLDVGREHAHGGEVEGVDDPPQPQDQDECGPSGPQRVAQ